MVSVLVWGGVIYITSYHLYYLCFYQQIDSHLPIKWVTSDSPLALYTVHSCDEPDFSEIYDLVVLPPLSFYFVLLWDHYFSSTCTFLQCVSVFMEAGFHSVSSFVSYDHVDIGRYVQPSWTNGGLAFCADDSPAVCSGMSALRALVGMSESSGPLSLGASMCGFRAGQLRLALVVSLLSVPRGHFWFHKHRCHRPSFAGPWPMSCCVPPLQSMNEALSSDASLVTHDIRAGPHAEIFYNNICFMPVDIDNDHDVIHKSLFSIIIRYFFALRPYLCLKFP